MDRFALALAGCLTLSVTVGAETLVGLHSGDADPASEGWTLDQAGPGTSAGAVNDGGTPAWLITDDSTEIGSAYWYRRPLSAGHLAEALSSGWRVRVVYRVENDAGGGESQFFGFVTGTVAFQVHLKAEPNGDVTARLVEGYPPFSGSTYTAAGSGYHSYELVSDGASGTASFLIDDVEVHAGYDGFPFGSANGARFGCGTSLETGTVYVSSVEWALLSDAVSVGDSVQSATWSRVKALYR